VSGSRAADLDSVVGSVCYAYQLAREGGAHGTVFPYLPILRSDLALRREVMRLLERERVVDGALVCADDVDLQDLLACRQGDLVLVDTGGADLAPALCERVAEVIDHHPEDQQMHPEGVLAPAPGFPAVHPAEYPADAGCHRQLRRRIVEPVGSACTLVSEQIFRRKPEILDRQLATLLLAAVLLDTVNLDPNAGRATGKDREIAGLLRQAGVVRSDGLYEELERARFDVEGLNSTQLLAKDYKQTVAGARRLGMSSVPLLLDAWRRRDDRLEEAFAGFLEDRALDLLIVFLYQRNRGFRRQLVLCGADRTLLTRVAAGLTELLELARISSSSHGGEVQKGSRRSGDRRVVIRCFSQGKTGESRKRIEPRLRDILEGL
jgi:exopolyphosphatase